MKEDASRKEWLAYKRLNRMRGAGLKLPAVALTRLQEIQHKNPAWGLEGSEKDEFAVWSQTFSGTDADFDEFSDLAVSQIMPAIRRQRSTSRYWSEGKWRAFAQNDPARAFEAIRDETSHNPDMDNGDEWEQLFWVLREPSDDLPLQSAVLNYLRHKIELKQLRAIDAIANWLHAKTESLVELDGNADRILETWDVMAAAVIADESNPIDDHNDLLGAVLNDASGVLTEVLLDLIRNDGLKTSPAFMECVQARLDGAINWPNEKGVVAQACLMQRLPWLETVYPTWVRGELAPKLNLRDEFWIDRWRARFRHSHPGSAELFSLTKASFLDTFDHVDEVSNHEPQANLLMSAVRFAIDLDDWPFTSAEAKQALLKGGEVALADTCRILRRRPDDLPKEAHWFGVVKPSIRFAWPLDMGVVGRRATSGLIYLIFESGEAFPDSVAELKDFLVSAWSNTAWDIEDHFEGEELGSALEFPESLLELILAIVDRDSPPSRLNQILDLIEGKEPGLAKRPDFRLLRSFARKAAS